MPYKLRAASVDDLAGVLRWIDSAEALQMWGGPLLTWPPRPDLTWQQMTATEQNTFVLADTEDKTVGFGQILVREANALHLGRIIISPAQRGMGLGRELVSALIARGIELYHPQRFTLNVYRENASALNCYFSLGFMVVEEYPEHKSCKMELNISR